MLLEQGDFIEVNFNPTLGHEPRKMRPALVVSVGYFNNVISGLTVVCPVTSRYNGHPLHIPLPKDGEVQGCVCVEALRALDLSDPARHTKRLESSASRETMTAVLDAIGAVFGI